MTARQFVAYVETLILDARDEGLPNELIIAKLSGIVDTMLEDEFCLPLMAR